MTTIIKELNFLPSPIRIRLLMSLLLCFGLLNISKAVTITSTSNGGNWSSSSTWLGGVLPLPGDDIVIATNNSGSVIVDGLITCANLTINSNGRLNISGANTLNVTGILSMAKPRAGYNTELNVNSGTLNVKGLFKMDTSKGTGYTSLNITSGTASLSDMNTRGTASRIVFNGNGILNLSGELTGKNPTLEAGQGTVIFAGALPKSVLAQTYYNLEISGSGAKTLAGNTTVNGTLNITGELNLNNQDLILTGAGNPLVLNGALTPGSGNIVYAGESEQTIASTPYFQLSLTGTGTKKILAGTSVRVEQDWLVNSPTLLEGDSRIEVSRDLKGTGTLEMENGLLTIGGSNLRTGEFIPGSGTVQYSREGDQTIRPVDYYNLSLAESGEKTIANAEQIIINNDLDVSTPLTIPGNLSVNIKGNLTGKGAITLEDATLSIEGDWMNEGVFEPGTSTVIYDGDSDQIIAGNEYYNLETAEGGTKSLDDDVLVRNQLTVGANTELYLESHELTLSGSGNPLINNGTFNPAASTVKYTNSSEAEIAAVNYHNLDAAGGPRKLPETGVIGVSGTFRPGAGEYKIINSTVSFNGVNQTIPPFTFYNVVLTGGGTKLVDAVINVKKLTLKNGSKLNVNPNNGAKIVVIE